MKMEQPIKSASRLVQEIKRKTCRVFSSEENIQIVFEGLRGEDSITSLCHKHGIHDNNYYNWSKEFMEADKKRLSGYIERNASTSEVKELQHENGQLKDLVAELSILVRVLKKKVTIYKANPSPLWSK